MNPQERKPTAYEDEINLYDLWKNVIKRKKLIFGIFFVSIISTGIISFMMPKIYQGEVGVRIQESQESISPGYYGKIQPKELISPKELYEIIGNFDREKINLIFPQYSNSIKDVMIRQISGSTDKFKIIFEMRQIAYFQEVVKIFMQYLNNIPLIARAVEQSRERLRKRLEEIDVVMSKSEQDAERFQRMMIKEKLNPIGFNPVEFNKMRSALEVEKIALKQSIKNLTGFEIVTNPIISKSPVRPRPKLYMAIAGVISLVFGIFLTMVLSYIENIKR